MDMAEYLKKPSSLLKVIPMARVTFQLVPVQLLLMRPRKPKRASLYAYYDKEGSLFRYVAVTYLSPKVNQLT